MKDLISQLETKYRFVIIAFAPAPRGFVAETFCLTTNKGKYFLKIISNLRLIGNMPLSLKVQYKLAECLDYIPSPIKTIDGEFVWTSSDNKSISLYTYIEGKPNKADSDGNPYGAEEDFSTFLPLAAGIYDLKIICDMTEMFPIWLKAEFEIFLNGDMPLSDEVFSYVSSHRAFIEDKWNEYKQMCERLSGTTNDFYITHGDMPGNLMIDDNGKLYIIDWDDIKLAPIERDFWGYMDNAANIQKITEMLADNGIAWTFSQDYYFYYVYTRFFDDLYGYMELDSMKTEDSSICARKIKTEVFDWLVPLMSCIK
ncbi:MAG: phosphotransferase [Oscillospiraceae bacterium]|nr:phosphotransferase [Oscillospiraceae bacterium]